MNIQQKIQIYGLRFGHIYLLIYSFMDWFINLVHWTLACNKCVYYYYYHKWIFNRPPSLESLVLHSYIWMPWTSTCFLQVVMETKGSKWEFNNITKQFYRFTIITHTLQVFLPLPTHLHISKGQHPIIPTLMFQMSKPSQSATLNHLSYTLNIQKTVQNRTRYASCPLKTFHTSTSPSYAARGARCSLQAMQIPNLHCKLKISFTLVSNHPSPLNHQSPPYLSHLHLLKIHLVELLVIKKIYCKFPVIFNSI